MKITDAYLPGEPILVGGGGQKSWGSDLEVVLGLPIKKRKEGNLFGGQVERRDGDERTKVRKLQRGDGGRSKGEGEDPLEKKPCICPA